MKRFKSIISVLLTLIMMFAFTIPAFADETGDSKMELKFNSDGKFKILAIADAQDTDTPQKETIDMLTNALDEANPDLVVFLGDNIAGWWKGVDKAKTEQAIANIIEPVDERGIPFAIVFGNHDHEGLCDDNNKMAEEEAKAFQLACYQKYKTCLAVAGEDMTGYCNYNLTIKSSTSDKDIFNLWLMDSNPYAEEGGYGYVQPDQTEWYIRKSNELKEQNDGTPLPSLLFQHIPVPEVYELADELDKKEKGAVKGQTALTNKKYYKTNDKVTQGDFEEGPCSAGVAHNQFETWKQQGDIIGAFFGHDHPNDYLGTIDGIQLCAVPATGYYSYGWNHGARTITLDENDLSTFETTLYHNDDLLDYKVTPAYKAKHGYIEYKNVFVPAVSGTAAGVAVIAGIITAVIKIRKKKK